MTPQYGFSRRLTENLIGINAVKMHTRNEITKDTYYNALSYLVFLKRKRIGMVKASRIYQR